jgi:starch-binding outer membrane protein, SusD/RagB family
MKTFKINKIFAALLAVFLAFASCNLIDLDTPSASDYSSDNLFKTVSQVRMTIYGTYNTFTHDIYSRTINTHYDCDNDEMQVQGALNASGRRIMGRYNTTPYVGTEMQKVWDRLYAGVERANVNIARIPEMDLFENGTESEKKELRRFLGEALVLRAYFMHDLVKFWGDVPFKTTPSVSGENFFTDRVDRDEIYDQIIKDLQEAIELLPWRKEVPAQARFTKGAAKGMLARIALHAAGYSLRWDRTEAGGGSNVGMRTHPDAQKVRGYYQIARDQTLAIIKDPGENHRLNPEFINIWKTLCSQNFDTQWGESMFEIGFWNPTGAQAGNGYIGNKIGVPVSSSANREVFGTGGSETRVLPTYYHSFNPLDVRRDVTVADFEIAANNNRIVRNRATEYTPGKWRTWWATHISTSSYTGINHILLRYADVLLMFAEAENWLNDGPTDAAIDALKQVRMRAFKGNEDMIDEETYPSDREGFHEVIMQERSWELGTEGRRKWDLIRWNKLTEVINATKEALHEFRQDVSIPLYVYYQPVTNPETENPKVFGNSSTIPAELAEQGYLRRDYRNGITATIANNFAAGYEENKNELYPIPIHAINANPALSQHPLF